MWLFNNKNKSQPATPLDSEVDEINNSEPESFLCATANVVMSRPYGEDGSQTRKGTKHFRGGAKVYVIDAYGGMCESAILIGHHRANGRYINLTMKVKYLENFRVTSIYSPKVISLIKEHYAGKGIPFSDFEARAQNLCNTVNIWADAERKSKQEGDIDSDNPKTSRLHIPET